MYCSAYATVSSVLDLSRNILVNDDENTRIVIARHMSVPFPLIRDLLILLHENVLELYEFAAKVSKNRAAEAYLRFIECLVGEFLMWRCRHVGVIHLLSEIQHFGSTPWAGIAGGDVAAANSPWSMLRLDANIIKHVKQIMQQIWRAYEAATATTTAAVAAIPFCVNRLELLYDPSDNSFRFADERYRAEGFKLYSFRDWWEQQEQQRRQQQAAASTSARR
jgi:hypothetical protein